MNLIPDQNSSLAAKPEGRLAQKNMTKAERRELQEKQRAAKLASKPQQQGKQTPQTPSGSATGQTKTKLPPMPQKKIFGADAAGSKHHITASRDLGLCLAGEEVGKSLSHGLRIFSHFGQPKSIGHTKGDIHPAIIRLGLLFSEFRICGANARCIATLTAFKKVSPIPCLLLNALNLLFIDGFR
jgi:translation initiation factor eIF-2B subunit delta